VELYISHHSLRGYAKKLQAAVNRYQSRLGWLLEGTSVQFPDHVSGSQFQINLISCR